jgi:myo-inositol-1(or 4)-monophosphatase
MSSLKLGKMMETIDFLKEVTGELHVRVRELFLTSLDVSKEIAIGADGEPTTYIDKYTEDFLINSLSQKFKCNIMSEEAGIRKCETVGEPTFIIDPIDGTTNAKRKLPFFSCSLALLEDRRVIAGFVRDLYNGDYFYAVEGQGVKYDDRTVSVSPFSSIDKAMFLLTHPVSGKDREFIGKISSRCGSFRILGCPSLEICYVASGKVHAAIQIHEKPNATIMDIAAAQLIAREAKGEVFNEEGKEIEVVEDPTFRTNFIACSNETRTRKEIQELILQKRNQNT